MRKIKLVVFDIAGTTVSDNGHVAQAFIQACRTHGHDLAIEEVNNVMGFRKRDAIRMLLESRSSRVKEDMEQEIESIHERFVTNMISFYQNDPDLKPLPYAESVFDILKKEGGESSAEYRLHKEYHGCDSRSPELEYGRCD